MRLIDADALKDYFVDLSKEKDIGFGDVGRMITVKIEHIIDTIENAPTIEPKRGEWIYGEHDVAMCDGYRCNRCDFFVPWDYEHKFIDFINDYHFCPNCGADMREREGE